ncbi:MULTISPECIES: SRPBCC family protein [Actinoplanes]|uniref:SRPBCC family protein n=1 Tax=Actinoplanes TaxID=1865 RepID=UPI0005F2B74E|nr:MULTISPECIES: SRPBCC family protein [Actinoplanes]GLY07159.1 polyketide cyclase [Actinoplanes sp. NBRC 101535]
MSTESRHLSVFIDRSVADVYAFVSDPTNLPSWAPGLGGTVTQEDGAWFVDTPVGRARITFAPRNDFGVLDHEVVTPSGETVYMPVRVITHGDGSEVIFTVRRQPGMTDEDYQRDLDAVSTDLGLLRKILAAG